MSLNQALLPRPRYPAQQAVQQAGQQAAAQNVAARVIVNSENVPQKLKADVQLEFKAYLQADDTTTKFVEKLGPRTVAKLYKQEFMRTFGNYPETYLSDLCDESAEEGGQAILSQPKDATFPLSTMAGSPVANSPMAGSSPSILDLVNEGRQPPAHFAAPDTPSKMPAPTSHRTTRASAIPNFGGQQFSPVGAKAGMKRKLDQSFGK